MSYTCDYCKIDFDSRQDCIEHMALIHAEGIEDNAPLYRLRALAAREPIVAHALSLRAMGTITDEQALYHIIYGLIARNDELRKRFRAMRPTLDEQV